jgi:hypothetical protein
MDTGHHDYDLPFLLYECFAGLTSRTETPKKQMIFV